MKFMTQREGLDAAALWNDIIKMLLALVRHEFMWNGLLPIFAILQTFFISFSSQPRFARQPRAEL